LHGKRSQYQQVVILAESLVMTSFQDQPKALFLASDGNIYPDRLICSGTLSAELKGKPCPYSQNGRLPDLISLDPDDQTYNMDKGKLGDLCPPCVKQNLYHLGHWQGHRKQQFPEELLPLRLFKCQMWLWLVIPGLYEDNPTKIDFKD
jgi:hypothetical protein